MRLVWTLVSHWVRLVRKSEKVEVTEKKDKKALELLVHLKIITLTKGNTYKAKINEEGKELYVDFFKHGYYPQDIGI